MAYKFTQEHVSELNYRKNQDVSNAARVYAAAFRGKPWLEKWSVADARKEIESWKQLIAEQNGKVFVVKNRVGRVIGVGVGHVNDPEELSGSLKAKLGDGKHYYFKDVAIERKFRKRGASSVLSAAREEHARRLGAKSIFSRTRFDNTARIKQFEKEGMNRFHEEDHETGGVVSKRIYFRKRLR